MSNGFWEPHSSSIDFCETNYLLSDYVVELHNTWSSLLGLTFFGVIGLIYGNPTKELRFNVAYFILAVIGIGSAGLHGTLHWAFQSSDELPMVYLIASFMYIFLEMESNPSSLKYPKLPWYLVLLMGINTIIYYAFQQYYWVFIASFSGILGIYLFMVFKMYFVEKNECTQTPTSKFLFKLASLSYICVATPIWMIDMLLCQWSLDTIANNMLGVTPHVAWHFVAGYGAYCTIVYLESFRMNALKRKYVLKFILGCIPVLSDENTKAK